MDGGAGADTMDGGAGDDLYLVGTRHDAVIELEGGGADTILAASADGYDMFGAVEVLVMLGDMPWVYANALDNTLIGSAAANTIDGAEGDDLIEGGGGDDRLLGGPGADTLIGGTGNDLMTGHGGADVFLIRPGEGMDIVLNFNRGAGDTLRLQGFGAAMDSFAEAQAASRWGEMAWGSPSGEVTIYAGSIIRLGTGQEVMIAGIPSLVASDLAFG
jgi:Ca2+-binding RTX toxin-like protein